MRNTLSKQEIHNWIDFLYSDLLQDNIYIGGYFFNLNQLKDFAEKKKQLDDKNQKILSKIKTRGGQSINDNQNSSYKALQRAQNEDFDKLNNLKIKIKTRNKFNELLEFPVMQDEFYFIYNKLEEAKTDIEHFRSFLLEELNNESINEETGEFMYFINDYLQDLRDKFSGRKAV